MTTGYIRPSILHHLSRTGGASVAALQRLIGRPSGGIRRVLRRMLAAREVAQSTRYPELLELTVRGIDAARAVDASQVEDSERVAHADTPGVVPPQQFDRMHGPLYVPDAGPALRPGAMDYKRCPTVGLRC